MNENLYHLVVIGTLIVIFLPFIILSGFRKKKMISIRLLKSKKRDLSISGIAVLFTMILVLFSISSFASTPTIIALGVMLSVVLRMIVRRWSFKEIN